MAQRKVEIKAGEVSLLALFSGASNWEEAEAIVTGLDGVERWDNIEIETVPKLFGGGSYIVSKRLTEKPMTLSGSIFTPMAPTIYEGLRRAGESLTAVSIEVTRPAHAMESIEAHITGMDWKQHSDEEAEFTLELLAVGGTIN